HSCLSPPRPPRPPPPPFPYTTLFRSPDGQLVPLALGGRARDYTGARAVVPLGVGLIGTAAQEGRALWTADFRSDERFTTSPKIRDRKSTRLNSSHRTISYAVFCLKKK